MATEWFPGYADWAVKMNERLLNRPWPRYRRKRRKAKR